MKENKNGQKCFMVAVIMLSLCICVVGGKFVVMVYQDLRANDFLPIPVTGSHIENSKILEPPTSEPIPPPEDLGAPSIDPITAPNEGSVDLRLTDEGYVNVLSDCIIIQYSDNNYSSTYELSIPFKKASLDGSTIGSTGSTPMMELIFYQFDPQISLQENVDNYLVEAFIFYEIKTPPSVLAEIK